MWGVHKAGCADPCGLEGQEGGEAAATGWQDRLAAPSGLSGGDQDRGTDISGSSETAAIEGELVHSHFNISGKMA